MPIEDLIDHPRAKALPAAGYGMLMRLCQHFWETECKPLSTDRDVLFGIARAHRPTWSWHSTDILAIFEETRPRLEYAWRARAAAIDNLRHLSARRTAKRRVEQLNSWRNTNASSAHAEAQFSRSSADHPRAVWDAGESGRRYVHGLLNLSGSFRRGLLTLAAIDTVRLLTSESAISDSARFARRGACQRVERSDFSNE